jgi:ABC-type oligopeptide transport system substrate-binding subunit
MKQSRVSLFLFSIMMIPLLGCAFLQSLGQDDSDPSSDADPTITASPVPPTSTLEPTATLPPEPTELPGSLVFPLSTFADSIPWLPLDPSETPVVDFIGFNIHEPPFDNVLVRKAFAHATNRQVFAQMATTFNWHSVEPATTLTPSRTLGRNLYGEIGAPLDIHLAQDLLARAGYEDPSTFPEVDFVIYASSHVDVHAIMALNMVDIWSTSLGVTVRIEEIADFGAYLERLATDLPALYWVSWAPDYNDPEDYLGTLFRSDSNLNMAQFSDVEFDRLVDRAATLSDPAQRQELYILAERILTETEAALIPLIHRVADMR